MWKKPNPHAAATPGRACDAWSKLDWRAAQESKIFFSHQGSDGIATLLFTLDMGVHPRFATESSSTC
jgi:hypothetical protein